MQQVEPFLQGEGEGDHFGEDRHTIDEWEKWYQSHYRKAIDEGLQMAVEGTQADEHPDGIDGKDDKIFTKKDGSKWIHHRYGRDTRYDDDSLHHEAYDIGKSKQYQEFKKNTTAKLNFTPENRRNYTEAEKKEKMEEVRKMQKYKRLASKELYDS